MIQIENYLLSNQRTISKTKSEFKKNVIPDNSEIISKIQRCLGSVDIWSEKAQISVLFSQNAE